ncbi:minor tail protein [Microbacterium phage SadLad]|nr:minor tail protein [Microbacterium phage SadLad]
MYHGFLRLGGVDVVNTERARGYLLTSDCPSSLIQERPCETLNDALLDDPYTFDNMALAPWFDQSLPDVSSRFFGVVGLGVDQMRDSTRQASVTEGIAPGGTIGRTRKAVKQTRVRATLLARGDDALEYGNAWLNSVFDGACGMHGDGCGTMDMEFLADCPPARRLIPAFTDWAAIATNLFTNPGMELAQGTVPVRRNLILFTDTSSATGWTPTAGTVASEGGRLKYVSNGNAASRLGGVTLLSGMKAAGPYAVSFRAQTADPTLTGVRLYLYNSVTTAIVGTGIADVVAGGGENRYEWNITATGTFDRVYMEYTGTAIATGAIGFISEPLLEAGSVQRPFFNGAVRPRYRRNLSPNPRGLNTVGWTSNNGALNAVVREVAPPVPHPLGIPTAIMQSSTGTNNVLVSLYNVDGLANTGTPRRSLGVWVLVTEPGYTAYGVELVPNEWTFVRATDSFGPGAYTLFYVTKISGNASTTARAYLTGAIVEEGTAPVGEYFDGGIVASDGFVNQWVGTAERSASIMYDTDMTAVWSGTAGASEAVLSGAAVAGGVIGGNVSPFQSTRWKASGEKSLRLRPTGASTDSYVILRTLTAADAGKTLNLSLKVHLERPSSSSVSYARSFFVTTNATPANYQGPQVPNEAGVHELHWTFVVPETLTAGTIRFYHGGLAGDSDIWVDEFAAIEGAYDGFFDGSTPDGELQRFEWTGAENASTSVRETRSIIERLQTDEEYAEDVRPLRRFMHNVAVTSGPIVVDDRVALDGEMHVVTVEWTITAERPWIFSATRPVQLPTVETGLVQDVPYNLIPHPSAEISSGTVVLATNFSTNPSVETNATGWVAAKSGGPGTMVGARVVNELRAQGTASFRGVFTPGAAGTDVDIWVEQVVDISTRPANTRISINMWSAIASIAGSNSWAPPSVIAYWLDGPAGNVLRADNLGTVSEIADSGAISAKSIAPPAGATHVRVRATSKINSFDAATVMRIYADALAVTAP